MRGTLSTQGIVKFLRGYNHVHVAGDRLDNHTSDVIAKLRKAVFDGLRVVVTNGEGVFGKICRHAF